MKKIFSVFLGVLLCLSLLSSCLRKDGTLHKSNDEVLSIHKIKDESNIGTHKMATTQLVSNSNTSNSLKQIARADMIYQTTTINGIASVSDTIVIGRFEEVESYVSGGENPSILTRGILKPIEVLAGEIRDQYLVTMIGGTVPYEKIAELYSEDDLAKYNIDPNNTAYESITSIFENMAIFEDGETYLITISEEEDGSYSLQPSIYSLCHLVEDANAPEAVSETAAQFNIDTYVEAFKSSKRP